MLEDSLYNTHTGQASRLVSSCQIQLHQARHHGQDQLSNACTPISPSACDQVSSPQPPLHPPIHTNSCPGHDSTRNLSDCRSRMLLFAVDDTRQADPGHCELAACSVVWQPAKPGGSKVWPSRFPRARGRSSRDFFPLCTLHETRLDRRPRSGRTNQVGLGLQLDG